MASGNLKKNKMSFGNKILPEAHLRNIVQKNILIVGVLILAIACPALGQDASGQSATPKESVDLPLNNEGKGVADDAETLRKRMKEVTDKLVSLLRRIEQLENKPDESVLTDDEKLQLHIASSDASKFGAGLVITLIALFIFNVIVGYAVYDLWTKFSNLSKQINKGFTQKIEEMTRVSSKLVEQANEEFPKLLKDYHQAGSELMKKIDDELPKQIAENFVETVKRLSPLQYQGPIILSVEPKFFIEPGGTKVTIQGHNFDHGSTLWINDTRATNEAPHPPDTITARVPPGKANQVVTVKIRNSDGCEYKFTGGVQYIPRLQMKSAKLELQTLVLTIFGVGLTEDMMVEIRGQIAEVKGCNEDFTELEVFVHPSWILSGENRYRITVTSPRDEEIPVIENKEFPLIVAIT